MSALTLINYSVAFRIKTTDLGADVERVFGLSGSALNWLYRFLRTNSLQFDNILVIFLSSEHVRNLHITSHSLFFFLSL